MTNKEFKDNFLIHRKLVTNFLKSKYALSNEEVEDVVQNTYVKIFKRFKNNNIVCEYPRQYLFNAAVNCTIEYRTRKAHLKNEFTFTESNVDSHEAFLDLVNEMDFSQIPHLLIEKKIISEELENIIDKLAEINPEMSQALKMFYFDEMQVNEISDEINIPVSTIKTRLHRGRNRIKSLLEEDMVLSSL
jgi:RNA polymerase sigma-70 factor (ECF subfamily)